MVSVPSEASSMASIQGSKPVVWSACCAGSQCASRRSASARAATGSAPRAMAEPIARMRFISLSSHVTAPVPSAGPPMRGYACTSMPTLCGAAPTPPLQPSAIVSAVQPPALSSAATS